MDCTSAAVLPAEFVADLPDIKLQPSIDVLPTLRLVRRSFDANWIRDWVTFPYVPDHNLDRTVQLFYCLMFCNLNENSISNPQSM